MKIHVIGNSHVSIFSGSSSILPQYPHKSIYCVPDTSIEFHVYHIGPTIAYNFYEHHYPKVLDIVFNNVINKEDEYILLIVGEVDCRWHIPKQASIQNKNSNTVVDECVERFFRTILDLKSKGYKCICWGGHPSTNSGHNDDPNCPVFGDVIERNKITKYFEYKCKEKCEQNDIDFISIVDLLLNNDGTTNMNFFIDYCHLNHSLILDDIINLLKNKFKI